MFTLHNGIERVTCYSCHYRDRIYWGFIHRREKDGTKLLHLNRFEHCQTLFKRIQLNMHKKDREAVYDALEHHVRFLFNILELCN